MRGRDPSAAAGADDTADGAPACPYCGGTNTERTHTKGPSLCRSLYHCRDCVESFEAFR